MNNLKCICTSAYFLQHNLLRPTQIIYRYIPHRLMAGHSKWANIKHIKALKDGQKSVEFSKLAQQMRIAIQEGKSANPSANLQLGQAIEIAKKRSMPVEKIQNILKAAQSAKVVDNKPAVLEVRGPGGCFILINILTDNFSRTKQALQTVLKKSNSVISNDGGAKHSFEHKGILIAKKESCDLESSLEHAIEAGAEDVTLNEEDKSFKFTCHPRDLHTVHRKLKELDYDVLEAEAVYIPAVFAELNEQQLQVVSTLIDKLQENPDVTGIYDNIA